MKYQLAYTRRAVKDIQKLDADNKERIGKTLLRYEQNPLTHGERLTNSQLGTHRFRIGDYRVVADIKGGDIIV